jgi:hypothetical protein
MTAQQAEKAANVLLAAAAIGAAVLIVRNPALRRGLWGLARTAIAASGPAILAEARRAWEESGRRQGI